MLFGTGQEPVYWRGSAKAEADIQGYGCAFTGCRGLVMLMRESRINGVKGVRSALEQIAHRKNFQVTPTDNVAQPLLQFRLLNDMGDFKLKTT